MPKKKKKKKYQDFEVKEIILQMANLNFKDKVVLFCSVVHIHVVHINTSSQLKNKQKQMYMS